MINEKFIDVRNQKSILESLLSKLKENSSYSSAFDKTKYYITNSNGMFCGRYDPCNDKMLIDKWFLYDSLCSGKIADIENLLVHEEAHRQNHLRGTYESGKPYHWAGWLNIYLDIGGSIPKVYLKNKAYEHEKEYEEVKEEDLKNIIILGYKNGGEAAEILRKVKESGINFIYVDAAKKIHNY
jgi:hypothetical protein